MKVLVVEPGIKPYVKEIDGSLKSMQDIVGGLIECVGIADGIDIFCNEEGKINGLEPNRDLFMFDIPDIIFGTFFVCGVDDEEGDSISLTDEQIQQYTQVFGL